jgi:cleavage and polyadenylation specificity factor subunit 4
MYFAKNACLKGDKCTYAHDLNKPAPDCKTWMKIGLCAKYNCQFEHPEVIKKECPYYSRGFCKLGPFCPHKHIEMKICMNYMMGFCPLGNQCPENHV